MKQTVLEKCGITNAMVGKLRKSGLVVPQRVKPFKEFMVSSSEDWFSYVADQFAFPLTEKERKFYIKHPEEFCKDLIKNTKFFVKTTGILYDAFKKTKELSREKALAAKLALIRIFHACIESTHLKYDRHMEYHEYKESPVGFYWNRLKELCLLAAEKAKASDKEMWSKERMLRIISGYGIVKKSTANRRAARKALREVMLNLNEKQKRELQKLNKILKLFLITHDKEYKIFYGPMPNKKLDALGAFFEMFESLRGTILKNLDFVKEKYRKRMKEILRERNPILASKVLMHKGERFFVPSVEKLYFEELKRWIG
jgi:hypothetical protein